MQKQTVFWLLVKTLWKLCSSVYSRATQLGKKNGRKKNAPVMPRKTTEMEFIVGLHASPLLFEKVWSHLSSLQHLSSHHKVSSGNFSSASDSSHLHHSLQKEGVYIKFINYSHGFFHITQAWCRPLKAVLRIKAGHSLYQRHTYSHFRGVSSIISNVYSHVPFNSEAFHAEF